MKTVFDMAEAQYYIHVGLPKTASTYLQVYVFPELAGLRYFGKKQYRQYRERPAQPGEKVLFSSEKDIGLFEELENIQAHVPEARIIVVFREHYSWICSKYKYHLRKSGPLYFEEFYRQKLVQERGLNPHYYQGIVEKIESLFPGRWLVLRHDWLKSDRRHFNQRLLHFLELDQEPEFKNSIVKPAFNSRQLYVIRKFNRAFRYYPSEHPRKWRRKLHYKLREFALHSVAQLARLNYWKPGAIDLELESQKEAIRATFREDWDYVKRVAGR